MDQSGYKLVGPKKQTTSAHRVRDPYLESNRKVVDVLRVSVSKLRFRVHLALGSVQKGLF